MPSERKTRDRTREREKDKKIRDTTKDKSSSDKYNDRKSSSKTKDSSKSTREKDRDRDKKREQRDKGDKKEEKERHKKKEEKNTRNNESERKSSKSHHNIENEKRRSSIKQHRPEIVNDDSDISEDNIKQENVTTTKIEIEDDYNYDDDDFEDYDEDFEEEDEEEEEEEEESDDDDVAHTESKLDSGNYDVQPSRQASVRMQRELAAVKEAMARENSGQKSYKQTLEMSDDSGRESPAARQNIREEPRKQSGFINFSAAKERNKVQIAAKAANSRGADLQKMIRLDIVNFDLLDLPPIRYRNQFLKQIFFKMYTYFNRYEAFMKTFGSSNSQQSSTQTGDDNLEVVNILLYF